MKNLRTRTAIIVFSAVALVGFFALVVRYETVKKIAKEERQRKEYLESKSAMDRQREERFAAITGKKESFLSDMENAKRQYEDLLASQKTLVAEHTRQIPQTYVAEATPGKTTYTTAKVSSPKSSSSSPKSTASGSTASKPSSSSVAVAPAPAPKPTATTKAS